MVAYTQRLLRAACRLPFVTPRKTQQKDSFTDLRMRARRTSVQPQYLTVLVARRGSPPKEHVTVHRIQPKIMVVHVAGSANQHILRRPRATIDLTWRYVPPVASSSH